MALFSHHNNQEWELGQTSVEVVCSVGGMDLTAAPWVTRQTQLPQLHFISVVSPASPNEGILKQTKMETAY